MEQVTFTIPDIKEFEAAKEELKSSLHLNDDQAAEAAAIALHLIPGDITPEGMTREQAGGPPDVPIPDEEQDNA